MRQFQWEEVPQQEHDKVSSPLYSLREYKTLRKQLNISAQCVLASKFNAVEEKTHSYFRMEDRAVFFCSSKDNTVAKEEKQCDQALIDVKLKNFKQEFFYN